MLLATRQRKIVFILTSLFFLVVFLSFVFSGRLILPQKLNLGFFSVRFYGIIMASAVGSGFYLALKRASKYGIKPTDAEDLLIWIIVGGFIGARLYHVFSSFGFYWSNPLQIFQVWNGGLSIFGAVLGGLLALIIYRRLYNFKFSIFNLLDWLTFSLIMGQIIGRFGNLFNYEAFGYPTGVVWKMFVPIEFRPVSFIGFQYFHPWFLYEILGLLIILLFLKIIIKKRWSYISGSLFLWYLLLYNVMRFILEFNRIDSTFIGTSRIRLNSISSLVLALLSGILIVILYKNAKKS